MSKKKGRIGFIVIILVLVLALVAVIGIGVIKKAAAPRVVPDRGNRLKCPKKSCSP
jgi:flagellar basal body-associated protein FliL